MLVLPIKKKWFDMIKSGEKKEEYRDYYLCKSPYGWKECFSKALYKPNEKGQIIIKKTVVEGHPIDSTKVHRIFNKGNY